jgi:hypothetical protein
VLERDDMWDLFCLRAFATMVIRLSALIERRHSEVPQVTDARPEVAELVERLGNLEKVLLRTAIDQFKDQV